MQLRVLLHACARVGLTASYQYWPETHQAMEKQQQKLSAAFACNKADWRHCRTVIAAARTWIAIAP